MNEPVQRGKPSLLEAGLPCASLSAECQRDNNARQRPPQNRLHIWWARRPPTVCRAAILSVLLPFDLRIRPDLLPSMVSEPSEQELENVSAQQEHLAAFFQALISDIPPTRLSPEHSCLLRALGVTGDTARAYRRLAAAEEADDGRRVMLGSTWGYRHPPAFAVSPTQELMEELLRQTRSTLGLSNDEPVTVLDSMAGGGVIPLEGIRYGTKIFANELNPVAATVLKATLEYPARFGSSLSQDVERFTGDIHRRVVDRLNSFFPMELPTGWWSELENVVRQKYSARNIEGRCPDESRIPKKNTFLWARQVPCSNCGLNIPLSTNFHIVKKKGKPEQDLAAFPQVPPRGQANDCTFRMVHRNQWAQCRWPRPDFERWHPTGTPTFKDGKAICPRCGHVMDGDEVKAIGRSHEGGLASQLYAVCSQVPVKLTYRDGKEKTRWLWRFRAPRKEDLDAIAAAESELRRLLPHWEAKGLVPNEEIPEDMEDKRPREYGMTRWRDFFMPRQLLTNLVILEEIRVAQERAKAELAADQAEAVGVYLAFILDKVVNYNSVNTFWHYGRLTVTQTFSRHDFAFRPAFCEFEGARETVMWGASQVTSAYRQLAALIHGEPVELAGDEDEDGEVQEEESGAAGETDAPEEECEFGQCRAPSCGTTRGSYPARSDRPDGDLRGRRRSFQSASRQRSPDLRRSALLQ